MRAPRTPRTATTWAGIGVIGVIAAALLAGLPVLNVGLAAAGLVTIGALVVVRRRSAERSTTRQ